MTRIFIALVASFFVFGLAGPAAAEKRVALVLGNGAYKAPLDLVNPPKDARAVAQALSRVGFEVLEGYDLKSSETNAKLKDFSRALQGADVGLFFYAGHGMQVKGENYLIPVDAVLKDESDLDFDAIKLDTVMRQLLRDAKVKIVILDACRDNPLAAQLSRSMGAARSRSLNPASGMAAVDAQGASGTLIAFATAPGNVAADGQGDHSPFTQALLTHLETPNLDIDLMMKRVRGDVSKSTGEHQQPWTNSSLTSEFFMKSGPAPATAATAPAANPAAAASPAGQPAPAQTASIEAAPQAGATRTLDAAAVVTSELRALRADKDSEKAILLTREQTSELNVRLILLGNTTGTTGDALTAGSRKALRAFQSSVGLVPTGYLNRGQYDLLRARSEPQFAAWVQQGRPALIADAEAAEPSKADGKSEDGKSRRAARSERAPSEGTRGNGSSNGSAGETGEFLGGVARGLSRGGKLGIRLGF